MKVRCIVQKLVFEPTWCGGTFRMWGEFEPDHLATHFRLDLHSLIPDVDDNNRVTWVKKELMKSTKEYPLTLPTGESKNRTIFLHFNGYSWQYNMKNDEIYICNTDIDI